MKSINYKKIIIIILIVLILGFSIYMFLFRKKESYTLSGYYNNLNTSIWIYQLNNEKLYFIIKSDTYEYGYAKIDKNVFKSVNLDNQYTFSMAGKNIKIDTTDNKIVSGVYPRVGDININDYFNLLYGDATYFNSKYNGVYKMNSNTIRLFQSKENEITVWLTTKKLMMNFKVYIFNNGKIAGTVDEGTVTLSFNGNELDFLLSGINPDRYYGKYIKDSKLSIEDILENDPNY